MTNSTDIFGLAFRDYLDGQTNESILVDINISDTEVLPVSYFFRDFAQMPDWEQKTLDACMGRILDVGAGAGSHALYLKKKGHEVTAIDVSPGAVECMQERGIENAQLKDFFEFRAQKFDTILFLMNGTGMAQTLDKLKDLLQHAAGLLAPGGNIYLESTDLLYMFEEEDGSVRIDLAGDYYGEITYQLQYKQYNGEPFKWLFVDFDNLHNVASLAGLDCEQFYRGENDNYIARLFVSELSKQRK
ncbi:MAG: class I SAM-dependent methyltransferase [Bacteroidetes bacterium]|nr:MAG: class I SAM-dependent methyltransferase [Bacteroidota bacterium]